MTTTRVCWLSQHAKDRPQKRGHSGVVSASFLFLFFFFFLTVIRTVQCNKPFPKRQPAVLIISPIGTSCYPNSCKSRHSFTVGYFILPRRSARARARVCVCVCVCVLQYLRKRSHWIPADTETPSVTAAGPPHRTHPQTANRKSNTAKICNKWVITFTHGISKCASVPLTDWRLSVLDPLLRFVLTRTRQHNLCLACQPAAGP